MDSIAVFVAIGAVILVAGAAALGYWWAGRGGRSQTSDLAAEKLAAEKLALEAEKLDLEKDMLRLQAQYEALEQRAAAEQTTFSERLDEHRAHLAVAKADLALQRDGYERRLTGLQELREKELAARSAQALEDEAADGQVLAAFTPVVEGMRTLQKRLGDLEEQRHTQLGGLAEQLKASQQSDQQLLAATRSLESALRDNSTRGAWGEAQLRNIVESAGLQDQIDFVTQATVSTEDGDLRPDMVVRLPGGKAIPVDAKVPFTSYIEAAEIPEGGNTQQQRQRRALLDKHVGAVRAHVDTLAKKDYGRQVAGSPDFTIAFIPSEALLSSALQLDPALLDYAFRKRIALASPVTLWSVLKTVSYSWQQENLTQEAQRIFDLARELHGRLAAMTKHADTLGARLTSAVDAYNKFVGSLESRVLVTARKLQAIDEDTEIPQARTLDKATRPMPTIESSQQPATPQIEED